MGKCDLVLDLGDDSKYYPVISKVLSCAFGLFPLSVSNETLFQGLNMTKKERKIESLTAYKSFLHFVVCSP